MSQNKKSKKKDLKRDHKKQDGKKKKLSSKAKKTQNQVLEKVGYIFAKVKSFAIKNKKVLAIVAGMIVIVIGVSVFTYFEISKDKNNGGEQVVLEDEQTSEGDQVEEQSPLEDAEGSENPEEEGGETQSDDELAEGEVSSVDSEEGDDGEIEEQIGSNDNSTVLAFQVGVDNITTTTTKVQKAEAAKIIVAEKEAARKAALAARRYVAHSRTSDLKQYSGKKIVLFMHASWCPYCEKLDSNIQANKSKIPSNVVIVKVDYQSSLADNHYFRGIPSLFQVRSNGSEIKKLDYAFDLQGILNQI